MGRVSLLLICPLMGSRFSPAGACFVFLAPDLCPIPFELVIPDLCEKELR
jgi:hypothetical protein